MKVGLIYPHQLFRPHPAAARVEMVVFVEDPLFFKQYRFHRQKLMLHRASMKAMASEYAEAGVKVGYVDADALKATGDIAQWLKRNKVTAVQFVEPWDDWLSSKLIEALSRAKIAHSVLPDPHDLGSLPDFDELLGRKSKLFFTEFYIRQRKRLGLLLDDEGKAVGGKWSFDTENRKRLPKEVSVPSVRLVTTGESRRSAREYVESCFPKALGESSELCYPVTPKEAEKGLKQFLDERLENFGVYEDAIARDEAFLFHSVLTPALNTGLLSPLTVVEQAIRRADRMPMNSVEGFVRQVIGWREYMKCVYVRLGRRQRSTNYWGHTRPMPKALYDGTTGIEPIDTVIRRTDRFAYCHHIERLMILGNFMLLCEIDPDAIYQWFMEFFIDAYDWVMVPNVYGMSQFADGGLTTTKPYISGSSYVRKMSDFKSGPWCEVWDGLYWRFIDRHRDFFSQNPRMSVMVAQCRRMGSKLDQHRATADKFLAALHR